MKFDINNKKIWRILQINEDYSLCPSYPQLHIVPASISDDQIKSVASFRSGRRFPSVVWRLVKLFVLLSLWDNILDITLRCL